ERRGVPPDEHRLPGRVAGLERLALELDLVVHPGRVVEAPPAVHPGAEQDRRVLQEPLVLALGVDGREPQPFTPGHLPEGGVREKLHLVPAVAQNPPQADERQDVAVRAVGDHDDGGQEPSPAATRARALSPMTRAASATVRPSTKSTSTGSSIWNSLSTIARNWTMASDWPPSSKKSWTAEVTSTPRISDHTRMTSFSQTSSIALTPTSGSAETDTVTQTGRAVRRPRLSMERNLPPASKITGALPIEAVSARRYVSQPLQLPLLIC